MRITMIAPFGLQPKGTTRWRVLPLARALSERGHAVRVLIPSWDHPAHAGRAWREGSVEVICLPFPARMRKAAWPILFARLLREAMRGEPDIVHAFKPIGFSGAAAASVLRLRRRDLPLVWVDADDYETGWAWTQKRPRWQQALLRWQERRVLSRADGATTASQALCELVSGWRGGASTHLPNTSALAPVGQNGILPYPETPGRVVWYTRFLDFPPEDVAAIWAEVIRLSPLAHLHVIGAGLRGEERAFSETIAAFGLGESVALCGWMDGDALAAELSAACAAMFPFADTPVNQYKCPARLADLTAAGVPVVAHAVGECATYIRDGETGLLLPPGSIVEFAQAVACLLADDAARARMRSAAQQHFAQQFAPAVLAARLEQAYTD